MYKKFAIMLLCFVTSILYVTTSFSQEAETEDTREAVEVTDETKEADETKTGTDVPEETVKTEVASTPTSTALRAKSYFDGVDTYVNSKVLFRLSASDNFYADKIMYKIDEQPEQAYTQEFSITEEGKHSVTYYGIDKIGNSEYAKQFRTIVDNTAPMVTIASKDPVIFINDKYYVSKSNTFTINAQDTLSGVNNIKYTINGSEFMNYATSFNFYLDGDAEFKMVSEDNVTNVTDTFKIKLTDNTGNSTISEMNALKVFVDNIAPSVTIAADKEFILKNQRKVASQEYKYNIKAEDKESGVKSILMRVDGKGVFVPYDNEIVFTTNGEHFIEAKATDAVGNISNISILSVYVDKIPPKSSIDTVEEPEKIETPAGGEKSMETTPEIETPIETPVTPETPVEPGVE